VASGLRDARDLVLAVVETVDGLVGVLNHEPTPAEMAKPACAVVAPTGKSATDFLVAVRVFADASADPQGSIDVLSDLTDAVESVLEVAWVFEPWAVEWAVDHNAWVASTTVQVPRDDF
jgi:hypothetical protein